MMSNAMSFFFFTNSQSRIAHKGVLQFARRPRKVVMEMGHSSYYFSRTPSLNLALVDTVSRKEPLLRLTLQRWPGVTKPNISFCQGNQFQLNHRNGIYKASQHAASSLTGIPDAEAFVACGVIEGPVQVDFVDGAGDAEWAGIVPTEGDQQRALSGRACVEK